MDYGSSGVVYADLDPFKVLAQRYARETAKAMELLGFREITWSRGESAYVFEHVQSGLLLAFVIEGLGTKNLVAENPELRGRFGQTFYDCIARCNVAMNLNDLITVGALPLVFGLHPAVAEGNHLGGQNGSDLVTGTVHALNDCHTTYGPGETPVLRGIIAPHSLCLSGAAIGVVPSRNYLINPANLRPGQRILLLESSGIHANGLSLAREIAAALPDGYLTPIEEGNLTFGQALLMPTQLYVEFVRHCQASNIPLRYAVNLTGHGWRKIMRASQTLTYRIKKIPEPQRVFGFMQERGNIATEEMYKTFNMGAGFVLYVDPENVDYVMSIGEVQNISVIDAGVVEEGPRQVIIEPLDLVFNELSLR